MGDKKFMTKPKIIIGKKSSIRIYQVIFEKSG